MAGILKEEIVLIEDEKEGSRLYNKGYYGIPQSGGGLKLNLMEALYLLESGRIEIENADGEVNFNDLLGYASRKLAAFEIYYTVYRDMRQRGYIVLAGSPPFDFRILPRGGSPTKTPTKYWLSTFSERAVFDLDGIIAITARAEELRKKLLIAIVDEEGDLTYYEAKLAKPEGKGNPHPKREVEGFFSEDRVAVTDSESITSLTENGFFGKNIGPYLQLSLIESAYLMEKGVCRIINLSTGRPMSLNELMKVAGEIQIDFPLRLAVYRDLKEKGVITKTGFKYGTHFRAYEGDPERYHARYLVHCFEPGYKGLWPEISRAVRLAHGVRKEILFARVGDDIEYLKLMRRRP